MTGPVRSRHWAQLFDDRPSLTESLAAFILDGLQDGGTVLVFIRMSHWPDVREQLPRGEIDDALADGRLSVEDAAAGLTALLVDDWPDPAMFDALVGRRVRELLSSRRRLSIYGEIVDILAARGDLRGAERLEQMWNELLARHDISLFCGYAAASFGNPRDADALRKICAAHTSVHSVPGDLLGRFLLKSCAGVLA